MLYRSSLRVGPLLGILALSLMTPCTAAVLHGAAGAASGAAERRIVRVSPGGNDANDGSSWAASMQTLSAALAAASSASGGEVWAAAGDYIDAVTIGPQTALYGGFAGNETRREQRNPARNVSTLTGLQARTCVTFAADAVPSSTVDGFVLQHHRGVSSYGTYAVSITGGSPTVRGNRIAGNRGGILCTGGAPLLERNIITGNVEAPAVDIHVDWLPTAPVIRGNVIALNAGGGIWAQNASATMTGNTIAGNAGRNGGITLSRCAGVSLTNNIVAFNGAGVQAWNGAPAMRNNCVYGNAWLDYDGFIEPGESKGNMMADPHFADVRRANWHIQPDSPCRNAGDPSAVTDGDSDMDGGLRVQEGRVDIGADESDGSAWPAVTPVVIRVSPTGDDAWSGASWAAAKRTIQAGVDAAAASGGEVWVRGGEYVESVTLPPGVEAYGGFSGRETARGQRDWRRNVAVVSSSGLAACFNVPFGERVSAIDGFELRTRYEGLDGYGMGVYCQCGSATLRNLTIYGFVNAYQSMPVLEDCAVAASGREAIRGMGAWLTLRRVTIQGGADGIVARAGRLHMRNCVVKGCGNAGVSTMSTDCDMVNNTFAGCQRGLALVDGRSRLANNLIAGNGSGISWFRNQGADGSVALSHNDVFNNGVEFEGLPDPTGQDGNIRANPLLAGLEAGDLHLQPNSPCVNAGDAGGALAGEVDAEGRARVQGGAVDIGALESDGSRRVARTRVVRVRPGGNDASDGSTWARAKRTLWAAVHELAVSSGEIWASAGVYAEAIAPGPFVRLYGGFSGRETAREQRDWSRNETVIDGAHEWRPVYLQSPFSGLDGFTVRNGEERRRSDLPNWVSGGGNVMISADAAVEHCRITGGRASVGGGIQVWGGSPMIRNNVIAGNAATSVGAGIAVYAGSGRPVIANNTILSNFVAPGGDARAGAGVYVPASRYSIRGCPWLVNNILAGNAIGIQTYDGPLPAELVGANDVYGNGADYQNCPPLTGVNGNFSADPGLADSARGDVHLRPGSPCIDAGINSAAAPGQSDIDGAARIVGLRVDVGADEYPTSRARR